MKERLNRFMYGRYGNDDLNKTLLLSGVVFSLISFFAFPKLFTVLAYTMLFSALYRFFSRKVQDRYQENQSFLSLKNRILSRLTGKRHKTAGHTHDKDHTKKVFQCPGCGQKVRVPKGKGTILITCPKCHTQFQKHT